MNPDQVVAFLHCHGISHFPGFTYRQADQFFRMVFDGPSQVHVSTPRADQVASAYGSWPSMIELEKAVLSKPVTKLSDHPDDAAWPHDTNNTQSSKAESRYQKLADAKHNQSLSTYETDTPCLSKVLSPEQMVVAVHADAELKRAFHKKRLTQLFGTQKKVRSNNNKTATSTNKVKQSSKSTAVEHHQLGKTREQVRSFNAASNLQSKTAIYRWLFPIVIRSDKMHPAGASCRQHSRVFRSSTVKPAAYFSGMLTRSWTVSRPGFTLSISAFERWSYESPIRTPLRVS